MLSITLVANFSVMAWTDTTSTIISHKVMTDSLMTEKIKMRKEIDRLEQKFGKTKQNRPNQKEIKVIPIDNDTDDNGNEWETVGAKKNKE